MFSYLFFLLKKSVKTTSLLSLTLALRITDSNRFRFTRETSFGRRHLKFWSRSPVLLWIVSIHQIVLSSEPYFSFNATFKSFLSSYSKYHATHIIKLIIFSDSLITDEKLYFSSSGLLL